MKGWAVERASRLLPPRLDWCINAGGDVVVRSVSGASFQVGIEDPRDRSQLVAVVPLESGGLATSGTAARGDHLYDPRTGTAATGLASLTVVAASLERGGRDSDGRICGGFAAAGARGGMRGLGCWRRRIDREHTRLPQRMTARSSSTPLIGPLVRRHDRGAHPPPFHERARLRYRTSPQMAESRRVSCPSTLVCPRYLVQDVVHERRSTA